MCIGGSADILSVLAEFSHLEGFLRLSPQDLVFRAPSLLHACGRKTRQAAVWQVVRPRVSSPLRQSANALSAVDPLALTMMYAHLVLAGWCLWGGKTLLGRCALQRKARKSMETW